MNQRNKIRLCWAKDGDVIFCNGKFYQVRRISNKILLATLKPVPTILSDHNRRLEYGINCQMWVEVGPELKSYREILHGKLLSIVKHIENNPRERITQTAKKLLTSHTTVSKARNIIKHKKLNQKNITNVL